MNPRAIHLHSLLLWEPPSARSTMEVVRAIGHVQIDSLYSIARSQDLVMHARSTSYREEEIWSLLGTELFEDYAHARSLLPSEEFPYHYRKMLERREIPVPEPQKIMMNAVLKQVRSGELTTSDVDLSNFRKVPKGRWSGLAKRLLDELSRRGYIAISRRERFGKLYYSPLDEVYKIPDDVPDRIEVFHHEIRRNLRSLTLAPLHRLLHYTYAQRFFKVGGKRMNPRSLLQSMVREGEIGAVVHEGVDYYHLPGTSFDVPAVDPQVFLLSPFDNALWSRESLLQQYGFDYKMEVYVPAEERVYGFFTMPILYGDQFVGRVDVKMDRKNRVLRFLKWSWETQSLSREFHEALDLAVDRLAKFHGADSVEM